MNKTKICVFAGTTEGRELIEFLSGQEQVSITACVATGYGKELLAPAGNLTISARRLDEGKMEQLVRESGFDLVIDATHPYADIVTENIVKACSAAQTEYLRLLRENSFAPEDAVVMPDAESAADFLKDTEGNILLTTGSKDLSLYAKINGFSERVYARVLPMEHSLELCRKAGLPSAHIFAMQGPFSAEMNIALLRAAAAKYLVTKDGGSSGGFEEKAIAARETGAVLVIIGRPPQGKGLNLSDTIDLLCRRFGLERKQQVDIVGIGPGSFSAVTEEARKTIEKADCVIGAERMIKAAARPGQAVFCAIAPKKIQDYIAGHREYRRFAAVMSGDTGFFSGAKKLIPLLDSYEVHVIPGISSLSYLCARLGTSYEDVVPVSLHGRSHNIVPDVRANPRVFALVGGEDGISRLCQTLTDAGLGSVQVSVGENLSYPDEKITVGTAAELTGKKFSALSAALIENHSPAAIVTHGLPDGLFQRSGAETPVPMTKSEVRSVCLSKLRLTEDAVVWDIGAGTGSVSIEAALQARRGQVYAIEYKENALALLEENRSKFGVENLTVISGKAPEICRELPAPTHAFIGGSSGGMREIIALLLEKNPHVYIVATAITLETIGELTGCLKEFPFTETEVVSLTAARDKPAGRYRLMMGQNPVYIFTMQAGGNQTWDF